MHTRRCLGLLALLLGGIALGAPPAGTVLLRSDFETDPIEQGWGSTTPPGGTGNAWTTETASSGTHSIRAARGGWFTPALAVQPLEFYAVSFVLEGTEEAYYGIDSDISVPYRTGPGWRENAHVFRAEPGSTSRWFLFRAPAGEPAWIDDVVIRRASRAEAAVLLDAARAAMPAFHFSADPDRHRGLARTIGKLAQGGRVRIVMLGDSIVNDTSHSYFEPLVERAWPGSRVEVVTSVRGGTGCWWYREADPDTGVPRIRPYVTDHAPDLVMIGGISHGSAGLAHEIDSIRDVIAQVRAVLPHVEFVLMTEAAGANDPWADPGLAQDVDPQGSDWRAMLFRLAAETRSEFLDLTGPWARYILASGKPHAWFLRDEIHMNARGSQVVGRALEAHFLKRRGRPADGLTGRRDEIRPAATGRGRP
jgi:hypothetical protein